VTMTAEEIDLLRAGYRVLARTKRSTASLFYGRLFEIAPETRVLFTGDIQLQGEKMMSTLGTILAQLPSSTALEALLADLARRHVGYGVEPQHYALLGEALMWTLEQRLPSAQRAETFTAWQRAYEELSAAMIRAADGARGA
jgi:hemoglobin-like flavoprotein